MAWDHGIGGWNQRGSMTIKLKTEAEQLVQEELQNGQGLEE